MTKNIIIKQPRWRIIGLQYLSYALTRIYLFISHSVVTTSPKWHFDANAHYVISSTHVSWADPFLATTALGWKHLRPLLPCRFMALPAFFRSFWLHRPMLWLGAFPSHPFRDYEYGLVAAHELRDLHQTVVIFPEGTRRRTTEKLQAKRGVGELARHAQTYIIPVHIIIESKTYGILPKYRIWVGAPFSGTDMEAQSILDHMYSLSEFVR